MPGSPAHATHHLLSILIACTLCFVCTEQLPEMLRRSLASAALRPFTAVAHGRHSCARRLSAAAGDVSIALPKFLVTTVAPKSHVGDKIVFDSKSPEAVVGELPVFLVDVKYEDNAFVAGEWTQAERDEGKGKRWTVDEHGKGKFSGTAVSQAEFTSSTSPQT